MSAFTHTGRAHFLAKARGVAAPTNYHLVFITSAVAADEDTATFSGLTEIAAGNGYSSGGISLDPNTTDFPTLTVDNGSDESELLVKQIEVDASAGPIPASGDGVAQILLTDDNATLNSREVYLFWDVDPAYVFPQDASAHTIDLGRIYAKNVTP
jgi:hypothetical protein